MNLKYPQEEFADSIYQEFIKDCPETQLEPNTIRDFIKWAIIKGYLDRNKSEYFNIKNTFPFTAVLNKDNVIIELIHGGLTYNNLVNIYESAK